MKKLLCVLFVLFVSQLYSQDNRVNDIWALVKFKGEELKKEQFSSTKPYIEIKIAQSKIGGNTGCNDFLISAEIKEDKIIIGNDITITKKACDDMGFETNFISALIGKTYTYKIENMKLYFSEEDMVVFEFKKID